MAGASSCGTLISRPAPQSHSLAERAKILYMTRRRASSRRLVALSFHSRSRNNCAWPGAPRPAAPIRLGTIPPFGTVVWGPARPMERAPRSHSLLLLLLFLTCLVGGYCWPSPIVLLAQTTIFKTGTPTSSARPASSSHTQQQWIDTNKWSTTRSNSTRSSGMFSARPTRSSPPTATIRTTIQN